MSVRLRLPRALRRFAVDRQAGPSLDFLLVFAPLIGLIAFAMQIGIGYFLNLSATDAAQRAARLAATLPPAHCAALRNAEGEQVHALADGFAFLPPTPAARACLASPTPCAPLPGEWTCKLSEAGDGTCGVKEMEAIAEAARLPGVKLEDLSVTYRDSRLGEAGGPVMPLVTVKLKQRDLSIGSMFSDGPVDLPTITATVAGEALGRRKWEGPSC
ncbi:MAG: hypothetical protein AAFU61_00545 [Pseudomonadota bacterium]